MLQGLHVLGGPLTGIHPGLVASAAITHELDVGVSLGDLALNVVQGRLGPDQVIVHLGDLGFQDSQLGECGKRGPAVRDLVQTGVQRLQVQQTPLTARVGFQGVPPGLSVVVAPMTKSHGSVRSVLM